MSMVFIKSFSAPPIDRTEILRYMGAGKSTDIHEINEALETCLDECEKIDAFAYNVCYCERDVSVSNCYVKTEDLEIKSLDLASILKDCSKIIMFAATVGIKIDRLIEKYSSIGYASKALIFQSIGAERIESLCDVFCKYIKNQYSQAPYNSNIRPRFSPGYGDFSIYFQNDIFRILDCHRKIGLSLCNSMMMTPSKSVTAIIGISKNK